MVSLSLFYSTYNDSLQLGLLSAGSKFNLKYEIFFPIPSTDLNETCKKLVKFLMALKIKVN